MSQISSKQIKIVAELPLSEIIENFNSDLKSITQGYASYNYELLDYRKGHIVNLKI